MTVPEYHVKINNVEYSSDVIQNGTITFGRQRVSDTCPAATAYFTILNDAGTFTVGDYVWIYATADSVNYTRFNGYVTLVSQNTNTTTISAVSRGLGMLARYWVPEFTMPNYFEGTLLFSIRDLCLYACYEANLLTDAELAARLMSYTGVPLDDKYYTSYLNLDLGPAALGGDTFGNTNLLTVLQTLTSWDPLPFLHEDRFGNVNYSTYSDRTGPPASWSIDADTVLRNWTTSQSQTGLINRVTVTYNGGTITANSLYSRAAYGRYAAEYITNVFYESSAETKAEMTLTAFKTPQWVTSPITVVIPSLTTAQTADLYDTDLGDLIDTTSLQTDIPTMGDYSYVEGWTEQFSQQDASISLYLSKWTQTMVPEEWGTVTGTLQWNDASISTYTWNDLIGLNI